jgi:hypothetical protein
MNETMKIVEAIRAEQSSFEKLSFARRVEALSAALGREADVRWTEYPNGASTGKAFWETPEGRVELPSGGYCVYTECYHSKLPVYTPSKAWLLSQPWYIEQEAAREAARAAQAATAVAREEARTAEEEAREASRLRISVRELRRREAQRAAAAR